MNTQTKNWFFSWQTNVLQKKLPKVQEVQNFLDHCSDNAVFQLEKGEKQGIEHYQGVFRLSGPRQSKPYVLNLFKTRFQNVHGLTVSICHSYTSSAEYCSKPETRVSGPYYCGAKENYDIKTSNMTLKNWQNDLFVFLQIVNLAPEFKNRIVITVEDSIGNTGKSWFLKWLRTGQRKLTSRKLPVSSVDRLISAVSKINLTDKVDLFTINLTRSKGTEQSYKDLFSAMEDIKDGYIVDVMYGNYVESVFTPPLMVIFTNLDMNEYVECLSQDRWLRLRIVTSGDLEYWTYSEDGALVARLIRDLTLDDIFKSLKIKKY